MRTVRFEQLPHGFRITAINLQWEGILFAAFLCGAGWLAAGWVRQEWERGAVMGTQHLFFGIPMALAAVVLVWQALQGIAGQVIVIRDGDELAVWEGVGPLGRWQRAVWCEVSGVDIGPLVDRSVSRSSEVVRLHLGGDSKRMVKLGRMLDAPRRERIVALLRQERERA